MSAHAVRRVWIAPAPLAEGARRAFADLVPYCLIDDTHGRVTAGRRPAVEFSAEDEATAERTEQLLTEAYERSMDTDATSPPPVHDQWDMAPAGGPAPTDPAGHQVGPGLFVSPAPIAGLMWELDVAVREAALALGAVEQAVPHLVGWHTLDRAGYPGNFPQHLMSCAVVGPDLAALDRFAAATDAAGRLAELRTSQLCQAPAVCLNLFAAMAGATVAKPVVLTARGSCGRHEATATASVTRRWSFTMREIVFVGDHERATGYRDQMLDLLAGLAAAIGAPARIVAANDPFFTTDRREMAAYQSRFTVKHELCGRLAGTDAPLAVASLNFHDQHFGARFDITLPDGTPARSVCLGFGLERWAHWLHGYLGDDPAALREALRSWLPSAAAVSR
jgi:seryl-tRNA synthetase